MAAVLGPERPTGSKRDLIDATIAAISVHGLSSLTSAKIAGMAGHTAASINFHFGSKEALLLATLRAVSEEFAELVETRLAQAGGEPLRGLLAIIEASLSPQLSDARKVAVWYAFLAESSARADYHRICGDRDALYNQQVTQLCRYLIDSHPGPSRPDLAAVSLGLVGLIDQLWQSILFDGDEFDRAAGIEQCRAYLASVFPWLAEQLREASPAATLSSAAERALSADRELRYTLPAWVYRNDEFFELEKERLLLPSWQIVCHTSELASTGDYVAFELYGECGFVLRGDDGKIRAFHNVCAHRAHAVVRDERGSCPKFLTCGYHGWTYHLDGRNRSVSAADTFPKFDRSRFGLKPIEVETFMGMVFVRLRAGQGSVAERLAPFREELAHYRIEQMVPLDQVWEQDLEIDWKNVVENYVEDYHFPIGHPGLSALMESDYDREVAPRGDAMRLSHRMRAQPLRSWSAQHYAKLLPEIEHLPEEMRRRWTYFGLFPNVFFDVYPEWLDYFHVIPTGPGRVKIRARSYGFPDERREMRAARYLSVRINARVQAEDEVLTRSVQRGLGTTAYRRGILSDKEVVLAGFQDWIRAHLPVTQLDEPPARGSVAARNAMLAGQ